jgi:hypothetical protein
MIGRVTNEGWVHEMMHEPDHTLCIMKQIVELPNTCLSTNIGLETNCRFYKPQNVPILYGHVS